MIKRLIAICIFCLGFSLQGYAQEIKSPIRDASPTTDAHMPIIQAGIALHDQGRYDDAIKKYQQVLAENPDDVLALYEMGYAYSAKKDYRKSLEIAYQGATYKSKHLASFYVLIGNALDNLNESDKALKVYQTALIWYPDNALLRFNLGVTQLRLNKLAEAKVSMKQTMMADPNYRSSHYFLSQLYYQENYTLPAIMALCRFLQVEPRSQRSAPALQALKVIVQGGAQKNEKGQTHITVNPNTKTEEGDFAALELSLAILGSTRSLEKFRDKTDAQWFAYCLVFLFEMMNEKSDSAKGSGFAWNYYRPYFLEMVRLHHVETFAYFIQQSDNSPECIRWLEQNPAKVEAFLAWSKDFIWYNGR